MFGQTAPIPLDAAAPTRAFPHFWEQMFGSGRANLTLRESYRNDLRAARNITGLRYVRFHGIFDDENGVYDVDAKTGKPICNWSNVDQIYDGLLENGARPFVELSFMPSKLASSQKPHAFWYKPLPAPPTDYNKWGVLMEAFARHVIARYGIDEVAQWYFEVWNEPNLDFWTGVPPETTYYKLYDVTVKALKRGDTRIRVGGPSTAQAAWVDRFIAHCVKEGIPADFVSTHVYGNDTAKDVFGTSEKISRRDMVARSVEKVYDQVKKSAMPDVPIIWSEYGAEYDNTVPVADSPYMGPWLANNIAACDGKTAMMSYWTFSDVFEEGGVVKTPFYGGFGIIAAGSIPKASFNAFKLLHHLGNRRIPVDSDSVLATVREDGSLSIAVWNYAEPDAEGAPRDFELHIANLRPSSRAVVTVVDAKHGSPLALWEEMGRPAFPTREQQAKLRAAAELPSPEARPLTPDGTLKLTLQPKALALIEVPHTE